MHTGTARATVTGHYRELAAQGAADLVGAGALDILRWTDEHLAGSYVIASSMQDAVLVHLASRVRPGVDVIFLDTGYHFAETIGTRDAVAACYDVNVISTHPEISVAEQDLLLGKDLFARDPNECCQRRKVQPLSRAMRGYCGWVTGVRRADSPDRADTPVIAFDENFAMVKVNPLADWTDDDVQCYIAEHDVMVNPLVHEGYPSIGCAPCTTRPTPGAEVRSGRWQGWGKDECGLHAS
ncbi:phosphoadenylyl-sulfate reductase [Mycobacterium sp. OTB74]|uniref:phosphoadenylyl-sulfate reductase n=1 Tax=Mycobacterium sp. OTB74 TaxID=1853452 RepID=UPI0024770564|nr:phosphoadenylyl-sulfate reductase [Mycobacterium sp. OTB74]